MATPISISLIEPAKLKNILLATDFSEASLKGLPYAASLARKSSGTVFLCHIINTIPTVGGSPESSAQLCEAEMSTAQKQMDDILESPELDGIPVQIVIQRGLLEDRLLAVIHRNDIDLIVAGTHGRSGFKKLLLGSVVEELCRISPCPVLTVGPELHNDGETRIREIVYPTDLSFESTHALPYAGLIAREYGARIIAVTVMPPELSANPDARRLTEPMRRYMMDLFRNEHTAKDCDFIVEFGETVDTVVRVVQNAKADLIAMGVRNAFMSGLHLRSSIAYRLMTHAGCPVLTCR